MNSLKRNAGLAVASFSAGAALALGIAAWAEDDPVKLPLEDIELFADVFGAIKNYYVDDVSDSKLIENAIKGMVEGLDPHSSYLDYKAFKDMEESTSGEFGGLGLEVSKDPSGVRVISPIDDTPAARAGVMAGDLIIKLDNKATADLSLNENVKLMRGKPKTSIVLTIARKGVAKPVVIKIVRDIIKIRSVKSKMLPQSVGYIRISQFQERTAADVAKAVKDLNNKSRLKGLVLDLRNNPGGLLNAAIGVVAAFVPKNELVVSTRGRNARDEHKFTASVRDYATSRGYRDEISSLPASVKTVPLVVLINSASASASEIVAGALQDHDRATIMGTRSFGKGSVQTIMPLRMKKDETTGVKITTARYYTPSGRSIQAKGIVPDVAVDDTPEGNYPSFTVRESDLAHHIEDQNKDTGNKSDEDLADVGDLGDEEIHVPTLRYAFGDEQDFPLQQAQALLLGKHVVTHEETQAKLRAEREKKAKDAKADAGQSQDKAAGGQIREKSSK